MYYLPLCTAVRRRFLKGQDQPHERDEVLQAKLPRQELAVTFDYRPVGDREVLASAEPWGFPPDYAGGNGDGRPGGCSRKDEACCGRDAGGCTLVSAIFLGLVF